MKTTIRINGTITIDHKDMTENEKDSLIQEWDANLETAMEMVADALQCSLIKNNLDVEEKERI